MNFTGSQIQTPLGRVDIDPAGYIPKNVEGEAT